MQQSIFTLEPKRKCVFTISANGTVNFSIECTSYPYEFHTPSGLVEFFASCGQALCILQQAAGNRRNVVPPTSEWCLKQFDYNKDITEKDLDPVVVSWAAAGRLRLKHLGSVFQVYPKWMPEVGQVMRIEGQSSTKEKRNLVDAVKDIVDGGDQGNMRLPFVMAEEMLSKARERMESNGDRISMDTE